MLPCVFTHFVFIVLLITGIIIMIIASFYFSMIGTAFLTLLIGGLITGKR
jgi:hypothetical protein